MSQSPEMPATGWFEQPPPESVPYPAEQWNGQQQDDSTMPQPVLPPEPAPMQAQPGYTGYEAEGAGLPTEFDHLFRGSPHDSRRSVERQRPGIGAASEGYAMPEGYQDPQYQAQQQAGPMQAGPMQTMPPEAQYSAAQFQSSGLPTSSYQAPGEAAPYGAEQYGGEQYGQPDYPQAPGYGAPQPQYGNQGYDGGGWDAGGGGGPSGNRKRWLIGGGVAAVAVIGIVYALSSGGGSGKPSGHSSTGASASAHASTPQQQAAAIYSLIAQSGPLRSAANDAVVDVNGCRDLTAAQSALQSTAQQRQAQADQVAKLDVSKIQNGTQLVQALQEAWSASAKYDSAYASIAGDVQTGCKASQVKKDPNYQTTNTEGAAASQAKVQAADLWNTNVAGPLNQQQISEAKL
ncbi:MAG TPA: hypothetical protein VFU73_09775 [Actinocrinis sp.]|nr:hypothetical protein [Actinocrinis sp.]